MIRLARLGLILLLAPAVLAVQRTPATADRALDGGELATLRLAAGDAQTLELPDRAVGVVEVSVRLDGLDQTLRLWPHSVRASDFRLLVADGSGAPVETTPPPIATVRGEIVGLPGSVVAGSLVDGRLDAAVRRGFDDELWMIQPLPVADAAGVDVGPGPGAGSGLVHAVYRSTDVVGNGEVCGSVTPDEPVPSGFGLTTSAASATKDCDLAVEADVSFYQANGSSIAATQADMESIVNNCEVIYLADVGVTYTISSSLIRTSGDPYSTSDSAVLLNEFVSEFLSTQGGATRDTAHLFTGRDLDSSIIGIAYLSVICNQTFGFGLSESRFTSNLASRTALTAHELGHNWGAGHCNGDSDCAIMCSGLGGCSGVVSGFGGASISSIENHKSFASCLSDPTPDPGDGPTVSSVAPTFGPESGGDTVVINGIDFVDAPSTTVRFDGVDAQIVSISPTSIVALAPSGVAGTSADIEVSDVNGSTLFADGFHYEWSINPGDKASSGLAEAGDVDRAYFEAPASALFTATLKRSSPKTLVPGLRLVGPGETELVVVEDDAAAPSGKARVLAYQLPQSGTYRLELYGVASSVGDYKLKTKLKPLRKLKQVIEVGPSTPTTAIVFDVQSGTKVSSLQWSARKAKGDYATVESLPSALLPALVSLVGPSGALDLSGAVTNVAGTKLKLTGLMLEELGTYTLTVGGAEGSVGYGTLSLKLKPAKIASFKHQADPSLE